MLLTLINLLRHGGIVRSSRLFGVWLLIGCTDDGQMTDGLDSGNNIERPADFTVRPGVETVTVFDAQPGAPLTLYSPTGDPLVTQLADEWGQTHFAYVPYEHLTLDPNDFDGVSLENGTVLMPGDGYVIQDDTSDLPNWSGTFSIMAVDDLPSKTFYDQQTLLGVHYSPLTGLAGDKEDGYQYIEVRDGVLLGAMIRFPDPLLYGDGPYPTVVEYSGYSPSRPKKLDAGSVIANALGYATVGVNMRGTGCSGGVFDVFNRAQFADGYDIIEIVARQEWVLNNQVGMVGLSYPGISQLYVASTNPPSLAAIVPLSTIADAWEMQWPGGIYNEGFTRQWVNNRDDASQSGGSNWVTKRIDDGDTTCETNLSLSAHSVDFESFLRALEMRPEDANDRDLNRLVEQIEAPVFYAGSFQDEQTGALFGAMMDRFYNADVLKVLLTNGRHPDGYAPQAVYPWFEFLEFYVSERIPELNPIMQTLGAAEFGNSFEMDNASFPDDRFTHYEDYDDALAAYESEQPVHLLFESGAGDDQPGSPVARFDAYYEAWPTNEAQTMTWFFGPDATLTDEPPQINGSDQWQFDAEAANTTFFGPSGYELLEPIWDIDWTQFQKGDIATYTTDIFDEDTVVAGPGIATLWVKSPVDDVMVQVTLTEIRSDGMEMLIQSGWLRLGHRQATETDNLRLERTYDQANFEPVPMDEWVSADVVVPSFAHPIRAGSALRMSVTSPGRNHGTWEFQTPKYDQTPVFELGYGSDHASSLRLSILPGIDVPAGLPPCPSLRGQPCRTTVSAPNTAAP